MPTATSTSRRSFLRSAGLTAAAFPILTESHFAALAQQQVNHTDKTVPTPAGSSRRVRHAMPADAVLINANENPLGPCEAARQAIVEILPMSGRYDFYGEVAKLTKTFATQQNLPEDHILIYAGSSEPLQYTTLAFTSPTRSFVSANPSYEAGTWAAKAAGAKVNYVPLTPTYAHDLRAMVAADPQAGVLYVCNPNNPTGTLTPREEILWALDHKPAGSILLVDEAYIHLSDSPSVLDQVAAGKDLIVLRTFSKIYGMAGIRCGIACGRPDLLARLSVYGMNPMPVTAATAANVSLLDVNLVPTRKKIIADTRAQTFAWLAQNNYKLIGDSQSNCFMIDTGRPGKDVIAAMQAHDIYIGRTWPVWPNAVRISVGTPAEMARFQTAFHQVMSA